MSYAESFGYGADQLLERQSSHAKASWSGTHKTHAGHCTVAVEATKMPQTMPDSAALQLLEAKKAQLQRIVASAMEAEMQWVAAKQVVEHTQQQLNSLKQQPAMQQKAWHYMDSNNSWHGPCSLADLLDDPDQQSDLIIHHGDHAMSLQQALGQLPAVASVATALQHSKKAYNAAKARFEVQLGTVRQASLDAQAAEVSLEAASALSARWRLTNGGGSNSMPSFSVLELQQKLDKGLFLGTTPVFGPQGRHATAADIVKQYMYTSSIMSARAHIAAQPPWSAEAVAVYLLGLRFTASTPCWCWEAGGTTYGSYSVAQLQSWAASGQLTPYILVHHHASPERQVLLKDIFVHLAVAAPDVLPQAEATPDHVQGSKAWSSELEDKVCRHVKIQLLLHMRRNLVSMFWGGAKGAGGSHEARVPCWLNEWQACKEQHDRETRALAEVVGQQVNTEIDRILGGSADPGQQQQLIQPHSVPPHSSTSHLSGADTNGAAHTRSANLHADRASDTAASRSSKEVQPHPGAAVPMSEPVHHTSTLQLVPGLAPVTEALHSCIPGLADAGTDHTGAHAVQAAETTLMDIDMPKPQSLSKPADIAGSQTYKAVTSPPVAEFERPPVPPSRRKPLIVKLASSTIPQHLTTLTCSSAAAPMGQAPAYSPPTTQPIISSSITADDRAGHADVPSDQKAKQAMHSQQLQLSSSHQDTTAAASEGATPRPETAAHASASLTIDAKPASAPGLARFPGSCAGQQTDENNFASMPGPLGGAPAVYELEGKLPHNSIEKQGEPAGTVTSSNGLETCSTCSGVADEVLLITADNLAAPSLSSVPSSGASQPPHAPASAADALKHSAPDQPQHVMDPGLGHPPASLIAHADNQPADPNSCKQDTATQHAQAVTPSKVLGTAALAEQDTMVGAPNASHSFGRESTPVTPQTAAAASALVDVQTAISMARHDSLTMLLDASAFSAADAFGSVPASEVKDAAAAHGSKASTRRATLRLLAQAAPVAAPPSRNAAAMCRTRSQRQAGQSELPALPSERRSKQSSKQPTGSAASGRPATKRQKRSQGKAADAASTCARLIPYEELGHATPISTMQQKQPMMVAADEPGLAALPAQHTGQLLQKRAGRNDKLNLLRARGTDDTGATDAAKWKNITARTKRLKFGRSKMHGWGMFALEAIEPEEFVIEYIGEMIRSTLADERERQHQLLGLDDYMFRVDDEWVVDATRKGGPARFINHSCDPNCYTKIIVVDGQKKIVIYSKRLIKPGEELTYDYKFQAEEDPARKVACNCGAKNCRKWMC